MKAIYEKFCELESKCRMEINAPASKAQVELLRAKVDYIPGDVLSMYELSNGLGIDVPSVEFYRIEELLKKNSNSGAFEIGKTGYGDTFVITRAGKICQIDHETNEVFDEWDSLESFLDYQLFVLS